MDGRVSFMRACAKSGRPANGRVRKPQNAEPGPNRPVAIPRSGHWCVSGYNENYQFVEILDNVIQRSEATKNLLL